MPHATAVAAAPGRRSCFPGSSCLGVIACGCPGSLPAGSGLGKEGGRAVDGPAAAGDRRLPGLDVARALAVIGMFIVHMGPTSGEGWAAMFYALPHGRASVLFVLVAGTGVSLLARSGRSQDAVRRLLAWRAAVLLPLGLWLQALDHRVLVILPVYAALFVLAMTAIAWDGRRLALWAAACAVIGPAVFLYGRMTAPEIFNRGPLTWAETPLEFLHGLLLSGPYPLIVWAAPFWVGMLIGRQDLKAAPVRAALVLGGTAVAAGAEVAAELLQLALAPQPAPVTWAWLAVDAPHSQMPLWLAGSTGAAAAVLGLCLEAADAAGRRAWPLIATGQMALTLYAGHLLLLHWSKGLLPARTVGEAVVVVGLVTALAVWFSIAWRRRWRRGPLEALLRLPAALANRTQAGGEEGGMAGGP